MLDLGCNIGLTVADYETMWPDARIIGVEMDAANATVARENAHSEVICAAVAAVRGRRAYSTAAGEYAFRLDEQGGSVVDAVTIADLAGMLGGLVDFVKMDIEGAEWEVLESSGWERHLRMLLVELHPQTEASVCRVWSLLAGRGFQVVRHRPHPAAVWATRRG